MDEVQRDVDAVLVLVMIILLESVSVNDELKMGDAPPNLPAEIPLEVLVNAFNNGNILYVVEGPNLDEEQRERIEMMALVLMGQQIDQIRAEREEAVRPQPGRLPTKEELEAQFVAHPAVRMWRLVLDGEAGLAVLPQGHHGILPYTMPNGTKRYRVVTYIRDFWERQHNDINSIVFFGNRQANEPDFTQEQITTFQQRLLAYTRNESIDPTRVIFFNLPVLVPPGEDLEDRFFERFGEELREFWRHVEYIALLRRDWIFTLLRMIRSDLLPNLRYIDASLVLEIGPEPHWDIEICLLPVLRSIMRHDLSSMQFVELFVDAYPMTENRDRLRPTRDYARTLVHEYNTENRKLAEERSQSKLLAARPTPTAVATGVLPIERFLRLNGDESVSRRVWEYMI